jgi:hypothetical protein
MERYYMQPVEERMGETAELLGINLEQYRTFIGNRCSEYNMSDSAIENGGLEGYLELEELAEYGRICVLIRERNLLERVNQDVEYRSPNDETRSPASPNSSLRS